MTNAVLSHDGACLPGREQNPDFVEVSVVVHEECLQNQFRLFRVRKMPQVLNQSFVCLDVSRLETRQTADFVEVSFVCCS